MRRIALIVLVVLATSPLGARATTSQEGGPSDAVVVAVIDSGFNAYHFDYRASMMPQALDADTGNDLPLDQPPHTWLPGFPSPSAFDSYQSLQLSLPTTPGARNSTLYNQDLAVWNSVQTSTAENLHFYWMPGTKVIGAMAFGAERPLIYGDENSHGTGTTSVGVGNLHGTCPECLLVHLSYGNTDQAQVLLDWAHAQPWIDVVSNSYGINLAGPINREPRVQQRGLTIRDQVYAGPVDGQRAASERGQTITFSAGNGIENGFIVPHTTYTSSIKGPDWVITVGAVESVAEHRSYSGAGKPVDVAGIGDSYPSAYASRTIGGTVRGFSGTSNASPTVAGMYARALYRARTDLAGPSRIQAAGVVATGSAYACGAERPACELGDGVLTAEELRARVLHGAIRTTNGSTIGGLAPVPAVGEETLLQQGHGVYTARLNGDAAWLAEFERIIGPLEGRTAALVRAQEERDFMLVDSMCRQKIWGTWAGGYWSPTTPLPAPDQSFPVRSALGAACSLRP